MYSYSIYVSSVPHRYVLLLLEVKHFYIQFSLKLRIILSYFVKD